MINVSLSAFRLHGEPQLIIGDIEGGSFSLTIRDSSDEFPILNQIKIWCLNADVEKLQRCVAAFNKEMNND